MSKKQECQVLQNIKYKTMLLNGNKKSFTAIPDDNDNLDNLLDKESNLNKKESWNKLDKSIKMDKINEFIETLAIKHKLTDLEKINLNLYLSKSLDKKNLYKNKEVTYIKESGKLENIPILSFNNTTRKFTLKKIQLQSTSKALGPTRKVSRAISNNKTSLSDSPKSNKLSKSPTSSKSPTPSKSTTSSKSLTPSKSTTPSKSPTIGIS